MDPMVGISPLPTFASAHLSPEVGAVESFKPLGWPADAAKGNNPVAPTVAATLVATVEITDRREISSP